MRAPFSVHWTMPDNSRTALIDRLQRRAVQRPHVLSLAGGLPAPSLFPRRVIAWACLKALEPANCSALQYGWPEGAPELRRWVARRLSDRGARVAASDVIITSGAQQAISVAVGALLQAGDRVRVDRESYPAALELFRERGLTLTTDDAADAVYVMPGVSNPGGTGLSEQRADQLLASGLPILADEAYAELRFDGRCAPLLLARAPERVFHIGTFSKTLCPGLRIGWLIAPERWRERALRLKSEADLQANSLSQAILSQALSVWDYDAHLARARRHYAERAERLVQAARKHLPCLRLAMPEGGFSIFAESELTGDEARLLELALEYGVSFDPGNAFHARAEGSVSLRLCHSNLQLDAIDEAVQRLARAWRAFSTRSRVA